MIISELRKQDEITNFMREGRLSSYKQGVNLFLTILFNFRELYKLLIFKKKAAKKF